ncbi:MAG: hypothetical protein GY925_18210 [Actinomycetia bacterium]|nr:hypothetical protein [Actinomycetes bacterium]
MIALLGSATVAVAPPAAAAVAGTASIDGPASASVGTNIQFTVSYSCSGDEDCLNAVIEVTHSGMDAVGVQTFVLGTLTAGSVGQVYATGSFRATTPNGATGTATAKLVISNGADSTNSVTVTAVNSSPTAMSVTVSAPATADIGSTFNLTIGYTCTGSTNCLDVIINLDYAVLDAVGNTSFSIGTVALGSSGSVTAQAVFASGTSHGDVGTASAASTLSNGSGGSASDSVTANDTTTPRADVEIGGLDWVGAEVVTPFDIVYTCGTEGPCNDVVVTVSYSVLVATGPTTWTIGNMLAGESSTLSATAKFPAGTAALTWGYATASIAISNGFDDSDTWALYCSVIPTGTPASTTTTTIAPVPGYNAYVSRSASEVAIGDTMEWYLDTNSIGSLDVENLAWTDEIPPELKPTRLYTGSWTPSAVEAHFEIRRGNSWSSVGTFDGTSAAWYVLPPDVEAVRTSYSYMGTAALPLSFSVDAQHQIETVAIRPDRDGNWYTTPQSVSNCGDWSSSNAGTQSACSSVSVKIPEVKPDPSIWLEGSNLRPTDEVGFVLRVANHSSAQLPFIDPFITFHMPPELDYVGWEVVSAGINPTATVIDDFHEQDRTLVRFDFAGSRNPGEWFDVRVRATVAMGVPPGWHSVEVLSHTNDVSQEVACHQGVVIDNYDLDQDGNTAEQLCAGDSSFDVVEAALTSAAMLVRGEPNLPHLDSATLSTPSSPCPDFDGFTFFPCVAQTKSLGRSDYRLEIRNAGNVDLTDLTLYNTLPFIGDSGVTEALSGSLRRSEWHPTLRSPLIITEQPVGAEVVIEYSVEANACRPELSAGGSFPTGCPDDWGPPPSDLSLVQAVRLKASFSTTPWHGGDIIVVEYDMDASHGSPFGGEVGWTSFGYTSRRADNGIRLPPSEPRKTGIMIKQPDNGIGSRVWLDLDRDGIREVGEPGINGLRVELYRSDDSLAAVTTTTDLQGDPTKPGYYFFGDVEPGQYYLKFESAPVGWNPVIPDQGADDSIDSDGSIATYRTAVIDIAMNEFELAWDMAYFVPGGPAECEDSDDYDPSSGSGERREVNDRLYCPS